MAFVFASVDGERDTPERLAAYVGAFDPDFIGLTGDEATLREIGRDYGLFFQRSSYDNTQADYLVDHTASSFVVGPRAACGSSTLTRPIRRSLPRDRRAAGRGLARSKPGALMLR